MRIPKWSYYIITSHEGFEKAFGKKATKNRKLYNGGIECHYYQYLWRERWKKQESNQLLKFCVEVILQVLKLTDNKIKQLREIGDLSGAEY